MYIMKSLQTRLSGYMEAGGTSFNGLSVHMSHWELGPACFDNDRIDKHQAANGGGIKQLYRTALQLSIFLLWRRWGVWSGETNTTPGFDRRG
jgi:hypothetical protein